MPTVDEQREILFGETPPRLTTTAESTAGRTHEGADGGWKPVVQTDDGRRLWRLPEGDVVDVDWDYRLGRFVGRTRDGQLWESPFEDRLLEHVVDCIEGLCTHEQGRALHELAREQAHAGGCFVEIGARKGLSTAWIGWGSKREGGPRVYGVDTFQGPTFATWRRNVLDEWRANIEYAGLADVCVPIASDSQRAASRWRIEATPITLLYIDAMHSYAAVRRDLGAWARFCPPGAIIAFDDCIHDFPGVMRLQRELWGSPHVELGGRAGAMVWWRVRSTPEGAR